MKDRKAESVAEAQGAYTRFAFYVDSPAPAHASVALAENKAPVTAVVTDVSGQPLSGANVTLIGDGLKQSAVSDAQGRASFTNASEGSSRANGRVSTFVDSSSPTKGIAAPGANGGRVDLRMALNAVQGIVVTGEPPAADARDSKG